MPREEEAKIQGYWYPIPFIFLLKFLKSVSSHGPKAPDSDDDFYDEQSQTDIFVDYDDKPYQWALLGDGSDDTNRFLAPCKSVPSYCSDDHILLSDEEQEINILSDTNSEHCCHLSSIWHGMGASGDITSVIDDDNAVRALGSSFPERASMADLVLETNISTDQYVPLRSDESPFYLDDGCAPTVTSSRNYRHISLDLPGRFDHFDIFETELCELRSLTSTSSSPSPATSEKITNFENVEDDLLRDDMHYQEQAVDISEKPCYSLCASRGITWFDFALKNDLGRDTTLRQVLAPRNECTSGVILANEPRNFQGGMHLYVRSASIGDIPGPLQCATGESYDAFIACDDIEGQDFVVIDF